jgi:cell division transport system ATP-binding protein
MIVFQDVTKIYKKGKHETIALDAVSFRIKNGEFVSLVGQSGAGKSTILKMINREEVPTSGHVLVNNVNVARIRKRHVPRYRRMIGNVFQDSKLLERKTAYENIAFAMEVSGMKVKEIKRDVPKILSIVGLKERAENYPQQLSGGEKQRVSMARALVFSPKYLLADEPTGNLDHRNTDEIIELLLKINELGTTVLLATHDKNVVDNLKKRVITIRDGKVVRDEEKGKYIL